MGENVVRAAAVGLTLLVVWAVLGGVIADDAGRDAFDWWSQIWIPLGVGASTVVVSAVALIASSRATRLAHEVERQREAAAHERASDENRHRLQSMAVEDARALMRWSIAASKDSWWEGRELEKIGADLHGPTLAHNARAALGQSLVPGAGELLALTEKEIAHLWADMPDPVWMPDADYRHDKWYPESQLFKVILGWRVNRATTRIREWGLDPVSAAERLRDELERMQRDEAAFFDYRLGLGIGGLRPLHELPEPPHMHADRVAWMRERNLGPAE